MSVFISPADESSEEEEAREVMKGECELGVVIMDGDGGCSGAC